MFKIILVLILLMYISKGIKRHLIKKYYYKCQLSIPFGIYANFDYHYFLHTKTGMVVGGATNLLEAVKECKDKGLYLVKIKETY